MKKIINSGLVIVTALAISLFIIHTASAVAVDKIDWCHCEPNGSCQTLNLPFQALLNAGHVGADGNPLHAGDHYGACVEEEEPTPTAIPTAIPTPTLPIEIDTPTDFPRPTEYPTPTFGPGDTNNGNIDVCGIPFLNACPTATPTSQPTVTPTITPTQTPAPTQVPVGGGSNQGSSNPSSSPSSSSSSSSSGGQVLGAAAMARTGIFEETLANIAMLSGTLLMGVGSMLYGKKNA